MTAPDTAPRLDPDLYARLGRLREYLADDGVASVSIVGSIDAGEVFDAAPVVPGHPGIYEHSDPHARLRGMEAMFSKCAPGLVAAALSEAGPDVSPAPAFYALQIPGTDTGELVVTLYERAEDLPTALPMGADSPAHVEGVLKEDAFKLSAKQRAFSRAQNALDELRKRGVTWCETVIAGGGDNGSLDDWFCDDADKLEGLSEDDRGRLFSDLAWAADDLLFDDQSGWWNNAGGQGLCRFELTADDDGFVSGELTRYTERWHELPDRTAEHSTAGLSDGARKVLGRIDAAGGTRFTLRCEVWDLEAGDYSAWVESCETESVRSLYERLDDGGLELLGASLLEDVLPPSSLQLPGVEQVAVNADFDAGSGSVRCTFSSHRMEGRVAASGEAPLSKFMVASPAMRKAAEAYEVISQQQREHRPYSAVLALPDADSRVPLSTRGHRWDATTAPEELALPIAEGVVEQVSAEYEQARELLGAGGQLQVIAEYSNPARRGWLVFPETRWRILPATPQQEPCALTRIAVEAASPAVSAEHGIS